MSLYQDGDRGRSILFPVSHLLISLLSEGQNLSANQILSTYINSQLITSGLKKQTSAILEYNFWYLSRPLHHNRRVILHQAAEFRPNRTTHGGNVTSYQFCNMAAATAQYYFRFRICRCQCLQKVKIYQQTKFCQYISIHSWHIITSGLEQQTSAILEHHIRLLSRPLCHNRRVILHQASEFRASLMTHGGNIKSYRFWFADLPIHYTTFIELRWQLRALYSWTTPLLSVQSEKKTKSRFSQNLDGFCDNIESWY